MNTLILRTVTPALTALMLLFSIFVLLRGHNEPGGGFIGGLIAVSALAVYGIAFGVGAVRRAIRFHPMAIAGAGLLLAALSGLISIVFRVPFMTGLWIYPHILGIEVPLSTVMSFDLGVYLVVLGSITSIALALEQDGEAAPPAGQTREPVPAVPTGVLQAKRRRRDRRHKENR
jgi:multicomponent Na+:H+ antiporter subunit B